MCVSRSPISQFLPLKFGLHQQTYVLIPSWHTPPFRQGGGLHWSPSTHKYKTHKHRFRAEGVLSLHCENSSFTRLTEVSGPELHLKEKNGCQWETSEFSHYTHENRFFFATYSFLIILKHLPGLFHCAEFLFTLPLQVVFVKHFLKMAAVVPALAKQHRVCRLLRHKYSSWKGNKRQIIQTALTFKARQLCTMLYLFLFWLALLLKFFYILIFCSIIYVFDTSQAVLDWFLM